VAERFYLENIIRQRRYNGSRRDMKFKSRADSRGDTQRLMTFSILHAGRVGETGVTYLHEGS